MFRRSESSLNLAILSQNETPEPPVTPCVTPPVLPPEADSAGGVSSDTSYTPCVTLPASPSDAEMYDAISIIRGKLWHVESLTEEALNTALEELVKLESQIGDGEHLREKNSWFQKIWLLYSACLLKRESLAQDYRKHSASQCEDALEALTQALALPDVECPDVKVYKAVLTTLDAHVERILFQESIEVTRAENALHQARQRKARFERKQTQAIEKKCPEDVVVRFEICSNRVKPLKMPLRMRVGLAFFAKKDYFRETRAFLERELPAIANQFLCAALSKDTTSEARRVISPRDVCGAAAASSF